MRNGNQISPTATHTPRCWESIWARTVYTKVGSEFDSGPSDRCVGGTHTPRPALRLNLNEGHTEAQAVEVLEG